MPSGIAVRRMRCMLITDTTRPDASALAARLTGDAHGPADAGYDDAVRCAREQGLELPMLGR